MLQHFDRPHCYCFPQKPWQSLRDRGVNSDPLAARRSNGSALSLRLVLLALAAAFLYRGNDWS